MTERVTWLLPVKNGMPYLPETLASIKAQTYRNWEVLAWDNGSTDGTVEVLKKWIPACLPGRVITDRHMGLGAALAEMVEECETEFCARIDADDVNMPERLEQQIAFLQAHPEVAVVGTQVNRIDENGFNHGQFWPLPLQHDDIVNFLLHRNSLAHPSVLFRRSTVISAGNYRDIGPVNVEDYDLWLRVAAHFKLANLNTALLNYRVHEKSSTQLALAQNKLMQAMDERFCENAQQLYGCSSDEARLLRERRHPRAIKAFKRIALHLENRQSKGLTSWIKSPSFIGAARALVSSEDIASRLALAGLDQDKLSVPREIVNVSKETLRRRGIRNPLSLVQERKQFLRNKRYYDKEVQQYREWLQAQIEDCCNIHPSLEFTGSKNLYRTVKLGSQCIVEKEVTVWLSPDQGAEPKLAMGDNAFIGQHSYLGVFKPITIGAYAMIGAHCYIISCNHDYSRRDLPIQKQGFVGAPIVIEDDVWLGTHVVVLPGVTIGKGAIVAAGAVVNKDIPPYEVWGGVPAKFIKTRP